MPKRRLTQQQKNRIKNRQRQLHRQWHSNGQSDSTTDSAGATLETSNVDYNTENAQKGRVAAHYGTQISVITEQGEEKRCHKLSTLPDIVAGDQVLWQEECDDLGVIISLLPRKTELRRAESRHSSKLVAANVDTVFIVIAPLPAPSQWLLDSYLVAATAANIEPIIVLNKVDLLKDETHASTSQLLETYRQLGYPCITTCSLAPDGISQLKEHLEGRAGIIAGQSGVGKSSLINTLIEGAQARVGLLSQQTQLGKHTTVVAQLYLLQENSYLIDSPGIREFNFSSITLDDIYAGFPEMFEQQANCKFRNCSHQNEPGCALIAALEDGTVDKGRFNHYIRMIQELSS